MKYIKLKSITTYSELYGKQIEKSGVIDKIEKLNTNKTLEILKILFNTLNTPWYSNYIYIKIKDLDRERMGDILYSKQTLFYTLKWIMAYSKEINNNYTNKKISLEDIVEAIDLQLMISDFLDKDDIDPTTYVYKNIYFNTLRTLKNEIVRAFEIYVELASKNDLYNFKEYVDINQKFITKYNVSIKEYISVIFLLSAFHLTDFKFKNIDLNEFFNNTKNKYKYINIVKGLGQDIESYKRWAQKTIDNSWDYSEIYKYPLIKIEKNKYISLESFTIVNLLFEGLYWKIVETADNENARKKIIDFLGRPFEEYVAMITEEVIEMLKSEYKFVHEFEYGKKSVKKSSDAYIIKNKTLFIIECKAGRPLRSTFEQEDKDNIKKAVEKFCVKSIKQAKKSFDDICKEREDLKFDKFDEIYIICVSLESVKHNKETINIMKKLLASNIDKKIKGYFNFNIEEYEGFCELLYNEIDVKKELDTYMNNMDDGTFYNYVYKYNKKIRKNSFISLKFETIAKKVNEIIFKG